MRRPSSGGWFPEQKISVADLSEAARETAAKNGAAVAYLSPQGGIDEKKALEQGRARSRQAADHDRRSSGGRGRRIGWRVEQECVRSTPSQFLAGEVRPECVETTLGSEIGDEDPQRLEERRGQWHRLPRGTRFRVRDNVVNRQRNRPLAGHGVLDC